MAADTAACAMLLPSSDMLASRSSAHNILLSAATGKRKTPSELRLEQLKRARSDHEEDSSHALNPVTLGIRKPQTSKPPRFVNARVADIYAATKPGDRPKFYPAKDKQKDVPLFPQQISEDSRDSISASMSNQINSLGEFQWKRLEGPEATTELQHSGTITDCAVNGDRAMPFSTFRNVKEISYQGPTPPLGLTVDMAKALKGMAAVKVSKAADSTLGFGIPTRSSHALKNDAKDHFPLPWIRVDKVPLDLSLKKSIRFISSESFHWCHAISTKNQCRGMQDFVNHYGCHESKSSQCIADDKSCNLKNVERSYWKALHSWVHPQSVLPPSVLSALASSAARGGAVESSFLSNRHQAWEDSFRSLYYMFRFKSCDLFYFATPQFIVMFIGGGLGGRNKEACSAYLTRSTRGLRSLLQEQDIVYSMPLCTSEAGMTTFEELQELTEFEKANPGQTRLVDSIAAVDNSSQSLLAFDGCKSVHGLYDFLLNYRFLLNSTTAADVPILYSPTPFQNAAIFLPEVLCKQMQRAPGLSKSEEQIGTVTNSIDETSLNTAFSLEIKGAILPPWVVSGVCSMIQQYKLGNFEASFVTDSLSECLNISQEAAHDVDAQSTDTGNGLHCSEMRNTACSAGLKMGFIKHLKYAVGSYVATLAGI